MFGEACTMLLIYLVLDKIQDSIVTTLQYINSIVYVAFVENYNEI